MGDKLKAKGYNPETIAAVIEDLCTVGLLDEKRFAKAWIRDRLKFSHKGKRLARLELLKKGVPKETIADAFSEEPLDEEAIVLEVIAKYGKRFQNLKPRQRRKRLYDLLLRRGFSFDTIENVLKVDTPFHNEPTE